MTIEEELPGGFSHPGKVVRSGDTVRRPPNPHARGVGSLLEHVAAHGEVSVPEPRGVDDAGREVFRFVEGDVPVPPYPEWAVIDGALAGVAALLRRYHDAAASFAVGDDMTWATELADPRGGSIVCHNDVCLENVVFRDGVPVGLLDFDLAAPGSPVYDVAMALRLCGPVRDPRNRPASFGDVDPIDRVRVFCGAYGLSSDAAGSLVPALLDACAVAARFVEARAAAGMRWFAESWARGGPERYAADALWVEANAAAILAAARP